MKSNRGYFNDMLWFELSDISFNQHYKNKNMMNTVILSVQLLALIVGVVFGVVFNVNPFKLLAVLNMIMLVFILANDYICDKTWEEAKARRDDLMAIANVIEDEDLDDEDIHLIISALKGYKVNHSDLILQKLVYKWLGNLRTDKRENTHFKDCNGLEYYVGDIVLNNFLGDVWYVDKLSDLELKESGFTTPYVLKLNGSDEEYTMEVDEPSGFEVVCTTLDRREYIKCIVLFIKHYKAYKRECIEFSKGDDGYAE